ncbi:MAG: chemotaxis response regulator protein-glutamate methylesterase [Pseudomonadota bacterium]
MNGAPVRVVVVDDSKLMRSMIQGALEAEGDMTCVGLAKDTVEARQIIKATDPDVVTLDVEMPGMNGLEFLEKIMTLRPMPVVMVSSLTQAGADITLAALEVGAVDAVAKPVGKGAAGRFATTLRSAVRTAARARVLRRGQSGGPSGARGNAINLRPKAPTASMPAGGFATKLIAIGASTGGVAALGDLLEKMPPPLPPIVITQHMPPDFTNRFASRLNNLLRLDVAEARNGETLQPNMVRIAPGHQHMTVEPGGGKLRTVLLDSAPVSGHKPSVDVLFSSVARACRDGAIGAILTGMGKDGAKGLLEMRRAGAITFGQSARSCVVYGMPRVACEAGAVKEEHDLSGLAKRINEIVRRGGAEPRHARLA